MSIRFENHITILSILYIGFSALFLLMGAVVLLVLIGGGFLSGETEAGMATWWGLGILIGGLVMVLTVPGIVATPSGS